MTLGPARVMGAGVIVMMCVEEVMCGCVQVCMHACLWLCNVYNRAQCDRWAVCVGIKQHTVMLCE